MDPFFQLKTLEYRLPGLDKAYTLLHISDLHLHEWDKESTEDEKNEAEYQTHRWEKTRFAFAKAFGDSTEPEHVQPMAGYLNRYVELANELEPDALVITGDLLECHTAANIRCLSRSLAKLNMPYIWARGNHEMEDFDDYAAFMGDHREWQALPLGKLKLIALNNTEQKVSAEGLAHFREEAEDGCTPVLLMHIPVMTDANRAFFEKLDPYYNMSAKQDSAFMEYLTSDACPVKLYLCGHIHGHITSEFVPGKWEVTASSAMLGCGNIIRLLPE